MAFDTSTKSTGYSVFEDGELIRCGYYGHEDIKDTQERMCRMVVDIYNVIEEYSPTIIVWEMPVVLRNPQTQRNLSMLVGAIIGKCAEKDIFFYQFRPAEWRKLVKNDGETVPRKRDELKLWGINKVKELFNIEVEKDDESDAILIGQAYINMFKEWFILDVNKKIMESILAYVRKLVLITDDIEELKQLIEMACKVSDQIIEIDTSLITDDDTCFIEEDSDDETEDEDSDEDESEED